MAPTDDPEYLACLPPRPADPEKRLGVNVPTADLEDWVNDVDDVSAQIKGIIEGTVTDFDEFDRKLELKQRAKQIQAEELEQRRRKFFLYGTEGKGEGSQYKWWCKRCFVEYLVDLPQNKCTRCQQSDKMMSQKDRREELMGKLDDFKKTRASHQWRKDKWIRWKKSQKLLGRSRNINYKAWEYWEPDTDTEDEGDPIVPKDNPEFRAMEADIKDRHKKAAEKAKTAERFRLKGNEAMKEGDFVTAVEHYEEGLEYQRGNKALWTNKALAELKVFRWHDAIASCNKVIEYSEIFEDGFVKSRDPCFKAFMRRAAALRALHRWAEAVEDLEDAVKLFPKDREARDLLEKTRLALQEAKAAESLLAEKQDGQDARPSTPPATQGGPIIEEVEDEPKAPEGPVRIEIEEDSEEEDEEVDALGVVHSSSLAHLARKDFKALLERLRGKESERVLFCARGGGGSRDAASAKKEDTRKVDLKKVEEVLEPSRLDDALRDTERCAVLWKKRQGKVVRLREEMQHMATDSDDKEADAFLRVAVPRAVAVLHVFASSSDHHCALTAPAVRHVWPLLSSGEWRHAVLELLLEWSQRTISARAMAEFASRYPEPHLRLLVDAVANESKENMLPPGFEERAQRAAQRFGPSSASTALDGALDEMLAGLSNSSAAELAVSTLGNVALAGQSLPAFREKMAAFRETLVAALARQVKPSNWRLCGRSAGAICNLLRLGDAFAEEVERCCTTPLVEALRDELGEAGPDSSASMARLLRQGAAATQLPGGRVPGMESAAVRLMAALINLISVRPASAQGLLALGVPDLAVPFMDLARARAVLPPGSGEEGGPEDLVSRATVLVSRLLSKAPGALSLPMEAQLLRRLLARLDGGRAVVKAAVAKAGSGAPLPDVEDLELTVRMLAVLVTKTPGALDRLTERRPRCEEVSDEAPAASEAAVPFEALAARLAEIAAAARPGAHVALDEEGGPLSRLRGNLALLFASLCEAQATDGAPPALRNLDLSPLVDPYVDALRKERGAVQNNIGVFITRMAQSTRYKQKVRDCNGLESLHQIQLPRVQAQKAEAERKHRIDTNTDARRAEAQRLRSLRGLD